MLKKFIICMIFPLVLFSAEKTSSTLIKEKIEIKELKKDLNSFYNQKEQEYQDRKKELEKILNQIKKEKQQIKELHDNNLSILQDMKKTVDNKTAKIYNSMKAKVAASIFNKMINDGKIEDVFDIILKLKEKNVTALMKYLSVPNAANLTIMLQNFNIENKKG